MNERLLIGLLTAINFTHILDFVIMMPLGPQFMDVFHITARQFAVAVSAYTFSAAVAAVAGALVIDRFERRAALLVFYAGFIVATIGCALAPDFHWLVAARIAAGACGGLLSAQMLAIIADAVPYERRGAAMGSLMSAFALASVLGIPAGVWLAAWLGWHAAFWAIAAIGGATFVLAWLWIAPMRGHLQAEHRSPLATMIALLREPAHWTVFAFTVALTMSGFMIVPFIATFISRNQHLSDQQLGLMYLFGGICAVATSPIIGRLADRHGKHVVFTIVAGLAIIPTLVLTNLPHVHIVAVLTVTTIFIIFGSGRFVPAMALTSSAVAPALRGGFMSLNSAVQSAASGVAAILSGLIITQRDGSAPLEHYGVVGLVAVGFALLSLLLVRRIRSV